MWSGIRKGDSHKNNCEDSLFLLDLPNLIIGGVFDGCSSGINSHVASGMLSASFKNSFSSWYSLLKGSTFDNLTKEQIDSPIKNAMRDYHLACSVLGFSELECLSTAIIFLYHKRNKILLYYTFGDGFVIYNDNICRITSQDNAPDYIAYHFKDTDIQPYIDKNYYTITNVNSFCIATDGLDAITHVTGEEVDVIDFLCYNKMLSSSNAMITRKFNMLAHTHSFDDDISIIRYDSI